MRQASQDVRTLSLTENQSPTAKIAKIHEESKFKQTQIMDNLDKSPPKEEPQLNLIASMQIIPPGSNASVDRPGDQSRSSLDPNQRRSIQLAQDLNITGRGGHSETEMTENENTPLRIIRKPSLQIQEQKPNEPEVDIDEL